MHTARNAPATPQAMVAGDLDSYAYSRAAVPASAQTPVRQQQAALQQQQAVQQQPQQQVASQQPPPPNPQSRAISPVSPVSSVSPESSVWPAAVWPAAMLARAQAPVAAVPVPVVAPIPHQPAYTLDTGDKLRIVVFGQDGLSNSYFVDAAGQVTMPLIGPVDARGLSTQELSRAVGQKLRAGFIREPHVAIEVETYRPFFILGEVTQPGQYPYVPNMTVETAVAIAGGYTPRAYRWDVNVDRPASGSAVRSRGSVPLLTRVQPGDTIIIKERWF